MTLIGHGSFSFQGKEIPASYVIHEVETMIRTNSDSIPVLLEIKGRVTMKEQDRDLSIQLVDKPLLLLMPDHGKKWRFRFRDSHGNASNNGGFEEI